MWRPSGNMFFANCGIVQSSSSLIPISIVFCIFRWEVISPFMRGQLLYSPAKSQFVKDIITQVLEFGKCKLVIGAIRMSCLQANKTYGDLEPNISLLKVYASIGFRAEELSKMEEEFEILNVSGRNMLFALINLHIIIPLDGSFISSDACTCAKSSCRH